jgi:TetR/AcrR family transcriptional regulator, mexJK operon transcriptional repressor
VVKPEEIGRMAGRDGGLERWRARRSDAKRRAILAGAQAVFLASGFGGASMDAVAAAAGVSKMTVYRHFKSKEALFAGLIRGLCDRIVGDDLTFDLARPVEEVLREYARRMVDILFDPATLELHRIVVAESRRFPALGRLFYRSGPAASIAGLADYLLRLRRRGRVAIAAPRRAAEEFLELLRGYAHLRCLLGVGPRPTLREHAARIDDAVARLLAGTVPNAPRR